MNECKWFSDDENENESDLVRMRRKMKVIQWWINKRMNEKMNKGMNERMNERINERMNQRMNERMNGRKKEGVVWIVICKDTGNEWKWLVTNE